MVRMIRTTLALVLVTVSSGCMAAGKVERERTIFTEDGRVKEVVKEVVPWKVLREEVANEHELELAKSQEKIVERLTLGAPPDMPAGIFAGLPADVQRQYLDQLASFNRDMMVYRAIVALDPEVQNPMTASVKRMEIQENLRLQKWQLWLNNPLTAAAAQRWIGGQSGNSGGTRIVQNLGHSVRGGHEGGSVRDSSGEGGSATPGEGEFAATGGAGSPSASGGGTGSPSASGDIYNVINFGGGNQNAQGPGTFTPTLEWATDLATTRPNLGDGSTYNPVDRRDVNRGIRADAL